MDFRISLVLMPRISFLIMLFLIALGFLIFSFSANFKSLTKLNDWQITQNRRFHLTLSLLFLTTLIYWYIDRWIIQLPDPIIPYLFFVLVISMLFTLRVAIATSILSVFLIEYYLYKPRYDLNPADHYITMTFTIIGILISLMIGFLIRRHEDSLIKDKEELRTLIKARDEFASVAAHDLKTPLTTIKLYIQSMSQVKDQKVSSRVTDSINTIDREADKLLAMIDRLLDFSKLQEGKLQLKLEKVDLVSLSKSQIKSVQRIFPNHKFKLSCRVKRAPVAADRMSLERILTNLLTNAAKYSSPKTTVTLEIKKQKNDFLASIKDQGKGIGREHLGKLFNAFYQADSSHAGLGLGLHITKQLVEMQKGKIGVKSRVNKGSTFFFTLPKA